MRNKRYVRKDFYQKVRSNKSPQWFEEQKREIEERLDFLDSRNKKLRSFKADLCSPEIEAKDRELQRRLSEHHRLEPSAIRGLLFRKEKTVWSKTLLGLMAEIRNFRKATLKTGAISKALQREGDILEIGRDTKPFANFFLRPLSDGVDLRISENKREIEELHRKQTVLIPRHHQIMTKEARKQNDKSVVARTRMKSRTLAKEIKRKLKKPSNCPYCMQPIGPNPHADHIYPLAHGGQETESNMVYICAACNLGKSDQTLLEYCEESGLDFQRISQELRGQGEKV